MNYNSTYTASSVKKNIHIIQKKMIAGKKHNSV